MSQKLTLLLIASLLTLGCEKAPTEATPTAPEVTVVPEAPEAPKVPLGRSVTIDGVEITTSDPESGIEYTRTEETESDGGSSGFQESSEGVGTGLQTSSDTVAQKMNQESPSAGLNGLGATGGGLTYDGKLAGTGLNIFYVMAAAMFLGAVGFVVIMKPPRWGTAGLLAAAGAAFVGIGVTVEQYPQLWIAAVVIGMVLLGAWLINAWMQNKARRTKDAQISESESEKAALQKTVDTFVRTVAYMKDSSLKDAFKKELDGELGSDKAIIEPVIVRSKVKQDL